MTVAAFSAGFQMGVAAGTVIGVGATVLLLVLGAAALIKGALGA